MSRTFRKNSYNERNQQINREINRRAKYGEEDGLVLLSKREKKMLKRRNQNQTQNEAKIQTQPQTPFSLGE